MAKDKTSAGQKPTKAPLKAPAKTQLKLPLKPAAPKRKKKKINQAEETKQFLTVLAVCTLAFTFLLYIILMKSTR
jgi:hypothetical protein